jgi:hypothetical protein
VGFGLRAFKAQEKEVIQEKRKYFSHIVIGNDYLSVYKFLKLYRELGPEHVLLITEQTLDKQALLTEWKCSMQMLRSQTEADQLIAKKPELEIFPSQAAVEFYKDTKFHAFGGRTKNFELKAHEDFFQQTYFNIKLENLFASNDWNELDEILLTNQKSKYIEEIEVNVSTDLIERTHYSVHTGENEVFDCEYLHFGDNPKSLLKLFKDHTKFNDEFIAYLSALETQAGLIVNFDLDQPIFDKVATVFLPQSITHEWGHFIGDIQDTKATFLTLLGDDDLATDEMAKKIKLLKRVLERTIPAFQKCRYTEIIRFSDWMFVTGAKENINLPQNFSLIGQGYPHSASSMTRSLLSILN